MEVWTLEDGKVNFFPFKDRNEANAFWKDKNKDGVPMITSGKKGINIWNSTKQEWFIPMIEFDSSGYDDSVETYILSEVWEMTIFQTKKPETKTDPRFPGISWTEGRNEWDVRVGNKQYRLTERFVRADDIIAAMHNEPDKYVEYTFWDGNKSLSSFCYET